MIHVDTSFLIRALGRGSPEDLLLRQWLRAGTQLAMSSIAWAEFLCGPAESPDVELVARILPDRVPFVDEDAALAARLFNLSGRRRGTLIDCMIAATALRLDASLATANPADFRKLSPAGLDVLSA